MLLNVAYSLPPRRHSVRASLVMDHFGIGHDVAERVLARDLDIPLQPGDVVLFTGASGSGKSSLLRELVRQFEAPSDKCQVTSDKAEASPLGTCPLPLVTSLLHLDLGTQTLVDAIPLPFEEALQLLAMCGLGEAPLMLRTPQELSDGQRYRFALALAIARRPQWIVADEFAALLDRTTAQVIAHNVRRLADRYGIGFLLATAQNDITMDLEPDIGVTCELDGRVTVTRRAEEADRNVCPTASGSSLPLGEGGLEPECVLGQSEIKHGRANGPVPPPSPTARKKKDDRSASTATSGSVPPPVATGRISLGGIIAATTSG